MAGSGRPVHGDCGHPQPPGRHRDDAQAATREGGPRNRRELHKTARGATNDLDGLQHSHARCSVVGRRRVAEVVPPS